jgi:hypothetical protein
MSGGNSATGVNESLDPNGPGHSRMKMRMAGRNR